LSDDSETQDPTSLREQPASDIVILQELRELKELVKDVQKRQSNMEKTLKNLASKLGTHEFDLAKSSHAVSISFTKKKKAMIHFSFVLDL
jgi:predicted patatin/cPLA2 family phospholipase